MRQWLEAWFPILQWLPRYQRAWLRADVAAGITAWAVAAPVAMAYAGIAGVSPLAGLFTVPLPLIAYAIFGTSPVMIVGPDSATALISFTAIGAIAAHGSDEFVALTSALALVVGGLFLLCGVLRLGWVANFISTPVMRGFVQGLAWVTLINQIPKLLKIDAVTGNFFQKAWLLAQELPRVHIPTMLIGLGSIVLLRGLKLARRGLPASLITVAVAVLVVAALNLDRPGVDVNVVGKVAAGLPSLHLPKFDFEHFEMLLPTGVAIVLIGLAESLASARAGRGAEGDVRPSQELVALGMANIGAAANGGFIAVGSLSQTSIAVQSGGKTQLSSLFAAVGVLLTLLFLMPLFESFPIATLAGIVIEAMLGLVNFAYWRRLRRISPSECGISIAAMLGVLLFGVLQGIGMGIGLSALWLTYRSSYPAVAVLGKLPDEEVYRDVTRRRDAQTIPGILIVRCEASPFFANARNLERRLNAAVACAPAVKAVIMDAENINMIDSTAIDMLINLNTELANRGVALYLAHVRDPVWDMMRRGGLEAALGPGRFVESISDGVKAVTARANA